jgi:hypothetical protein
MLKRDQLIPLSLTIVTLVGIICIFYTSINILNLFPGTKILTTFSWVDVAIGLTIYLKTSIDFAIFIGSLMKQYDGMKNRIAIEVGTAFGNLMGTIAVMILWYFFKEIKWLLGLMILFASLVLFKLAQTSVEHVVEVQDDGHENDYHPAFVRTAHLIMRILNPINSFLDPVLGKIIPHFGENKVKTTTFLGLLGTSFSIPFILGLDDFAGYVPLFSVINIFGFGIGVFLGHTILNILLFINPRLTIKTVKNPAISILGAIVFVGLGTWGLWEVLHLVFKI